jgi:hypothetical protein
VSLREEARPVVDAAGHVAAVHEVVGGVLGGASWTRRRR